MQCTVDSRDTQLFWLKEWFPNKKEHILNVIKTKKFFL